MPGDGVFRQYAAKIDSTFLDQVLAASASPNPAVEQYAPLGSVDVTATVLLGADPAFAVSSSKIGAVLDLIPLDGKDVSSEFTTSWIERTHGGAGFEAAGEKVTASKCLAVLERLSCEERGNALIQIGGYAYSANGTTHPLAEGSALPSGTPAVADLYGLGQVLVDGSPVSGPQSVEIDFGNQVERVKSSHLTYATMAHIMDPRRGRVTIRCRDLGGLSSARLVGSEVPVVLNLLKRSVTGTGWAGAGNRTVTVTKAFVHAAVPGPEGLTLACEAKKQGANALFIFGS